MKVLTLVAFAFSVYTSSLALANTLNFDDSEFLAQKNAVITKFLKEANNPKSSVGKKIAKINLSTEDGRNDNGTISLPVKQSDLQIVMINAEVNFAPWHYALKENSVCKATGNSAQFIIYLIQTQGVHYAVNLNTVSFVASAKQTMSARILKDSDDVHCEFLSPSEGDSDPNFGEISSEMKVSEIKFVPAQDLEEQNY